MKPKRIPFPTSPAYDRNERVPLVGYDRQGNEKRHGDARCIICNKPLWTAKARSVHMFITAELALGYDDEPAEGEPGSIAEPGQTGLSQGWWPCGNDCYDRYVKPHVEKEG